jgi:hypothetical protein
MFCSVITGELAADFPTSYNVASYCYDRYSQVSPKRQRRESQARMLIVKALVSVEQPLVQVNNRK